MNKNLRRTLGLTLIVITMILVIVGVRFDKHLQSNPSVFVFFWALCLILVCLILVVAACDTLAVRKELKNRQTKLDNQMADYIAEAKQKKL